MSPEEAILKQKRKEEKRKDANAIERRRIKEFNDALNRLRNVTKHITIDNKKKGRKVTKLTTIRAAIMHIDNLERLLQMNNDDLVDCVVGNDIVVESIKDHQEDQSEVTIECKGELRDIANSTTSQVTSDQENNLELRDLIKTEKECTEKKVKAKLIGEVFDQDYLLVDDNGEYKVVTIEQRYALPHLLYFDNCWAQNKWMDCAEDMVCLSDSRAKLSVIVSE